jgi:MFS family permease
MLTRVLPWLSCLVVLAFGYTTGMQLGKVSPYVDRLEADLGLGLVWSGWLTSMLAIFVAIAAAPAGRLIARTGTVAALKAAALIMAIGAILFGIVSGPGWLLAARAVEAPAMYWPWSPLQPISRPRPRVASRPPSSHFGAALCRSASRSRTCWRPASPT